LYLSSLLPIKNNFINVDFVYELVRISFGSDGLQFIMNQGKGQYRRTDNTMAKRERANNDLQNTTQKTKY
jgi:hypothetical protein